MPFKIHSPPCRFVRFDTIPVVVIAKAPLGDLLQVLLFRVFLSPYYPSMCRVPSTSLKCCTRRLFVWLPPQYLHCRRDEAFPHNSRCGCEGVLVVAIKGGEALSLPCFALFHVLSLATFSGVDLLLNCLAYALGWPALAGAAAMRAFALRLANAVKRGVLGGCSGPCP